MIGHWAAQLYIDIHAARQCRPVTRGLSALPVARPCRSSATATQTA